MTVGVTNCHPEPTWEIQDEGRRIEASRDLDLNSGSASNNGHK